MSGFDDALLSMGRVRAWREVLLTLGAILGVVCIVAAIASAAFGINPLVFRSGSMSPTIETGALAFAKSFPAADLRVGDIVSVTDSKGARVTHRATIISLDGSTVSLTLKGDANKVPDAEIYTVNSADRVFFSVPKAGYVVSWLSGPVGIFLGGLLVGGLLFIAFWPRAGGSDHSGKRRAVASGMVLVVGVAGLGGLNLLRASPTMAAWNDTASARTGQFEAVTVAPPANASCRISSANGLWVDLSWEQTDSRNDYTLQIQRRRLNGTWVDEREPRAIAGTGQGRASTTIRVVDVPLLGKYKAIVTSHLRTAPLWESTSVEIPFEQVLYLVVPGNICN